MPIAHTGTADHPDRTLHDIVDQQRHLRLVRQRGRLVRGIIASLIPQHARHVEPFKGAIWFA